MSSIDMEKGPNVDAGQLSPTDSNDSTELKIVDWEGPSDPVNPQNWSLWKRGTIMGIVTAIVFSTCMATSAIAPAVPQILEEFGEVDSELGTLVVTIELLGTAVGPLVLAPLSEVRGRCIVYNIANLGFCAFSAGCAMTPTLGGLIVMRFLQGCFASSSVSNGGGTIADIFPPHRRGAAMCLFSMGVLVAPVVGPILGASIACSLGWRWIFWFLLILNGTLGSICAATCQETYGPVILERKRRVIERGAGSTACHAPGGLPLSASAVFKKAITRPLIMLILCPIISTLSLYIAVVYGFAYLLLSTFSIVFEEQYHYHGGKLGLAYLGLAGGMLLSLGLASVVSDRTYLRLTRKYGKEKPEYRLELLIYGAVAIPIGLLLYGWAAENRIHAAIPITATGCVGFGVMFTFIPIQTYMTNAYPQYAASAIAASSVLRSISGGLVPLAGVPLYDRLGLGWGNSLLALFSLGLSGLPLLFCKYGELWRKKFLIQ